MFADYGLHERLLKALSALSFVEPTAVQAAAIPPALEGRDLRVTAKTGSGKTAAFVLPMLQRLLETPKPQTGARALILLPTRELALQTLKEVERFAQFTFLKAGLITGGEGFKDQAAALRKNPEIVIGTPGRVLNHLETGSLELGDVEVLVLDEADRMLDMGLSEDVLKIAGACPQERQTMLFSATAGERALGQMVSAVLRDPQLLLLNRRDDLNENLKQQIVTADDVPHKERLLQWLLAHETFAQAIVFTNTRAQADRLAGVLRASAVKSYVLHGEKTQEERKQAVERLRQGNINVLIATDVAARGLDIEGVDLVINFDMPRSGDEYVHRIGRAGRVGQAGLAISLICHNDWNLMSSIERYLKQSFERRVIKELQGSYQGPKKLKASGKAAGSKKKKLAKKSGATAKAGSKPPARKGGKAPATLGDGFTAPKRKKPSPPAG
ncbi:DEAD/DEAH box helicase [Pseudomonas sp. GCM10022188]|uniref:DEAD/DEAH box helicase n=1 Tax=Pseudomonas TaxID=286 RepID=UPI001E599F18|nr:DEAD/DEAH box helicase [Pseudomonas oryzagri]MCC6073864.1 DEAD/DEAH box helicase [Pseudomonas oryzagri]